MRRRLLLAVALAAVALGIAVSWAWRQWTVPVGEPATDTVLVPIPAGMTLSAAADTLVARGLLENRRVLLLGARLSGRARDLKTGLYALSPAQSPRDLLDALTTGRGVQVRVTVPEGLDADEAAALVCAELACDPAAFLAAADSLVAGAMAAGRLGEAGLEPRLARQVATESAALPRQLRLCEGYLAPDTYLFATGTGAAAAADHLVRMQLSRLDRAAAAAVPGAPTGHELLVLASIVEAEARRDDERTRIAAVYANRLARGMKLEADPTVAHVLDKKGKRLFYRDLEVESAWNTYRHAGLPPGPIGSPGLASLLAAAAPDPACDALFFVADGENGHVFSRTMAEHEEAVRRFRKLREAERRRQRD